ncbi:MAG TPA: glycosyltransferase [Pyrinomonadaceae bacterium]|nr:glycosyltransferase [Pyrinomonadaceae bacterium]
MRQAITNLVRPPVLPSTTSVRPCVRGKFIFVGDEKLFVCGVTYGPFRPDEDGCEYHNPEVVARDFALMAENGVNTVRTYTVPPRWLLDVAQQHGLRVMVGLPWEQHITFLDDKKRAQSIEERVRAGVRACAGHPAILCYTIGNEIPASIVRWYGRRRIERFLERLYWAAKAEDPDGLVTYVNYPTTEYLQLPFVDFVCFNVYLESQEPLEAYLARLQNLAGNKPLIMAEIGLDSQRNGEEVQASTLDWQIRTAFAGGCAGIFVFAWTDEWHRGGHDIEDWDFGLIRRDRSPKRALSIVGRVYAEAPFPADTIWPEISVIVCSYNGCRTIGDCCEGLSQLDYPNYEVLIVDDGSSDKTAAIASAYGFRVISTENRGLSNARNIGLEEASGEIIAYIDDDARPDPHWLTYLAATFLNTYFVAVGGPNITIPEDGWIAECIGNSPGNPTHILLTDQIAEHIPGCNMAFRKTALQAVGGFDPQFRIAGDDVDICWSLQRRGWTLGFNPAAMVWHHRRSSVKAYWKQQLNYGKAEALLEMKWPEKYNTVGHLIWRGRLYNDGLTPTALFRSWRIYYGVWGSRLFQSVYDTAPHTLLSLAAMPEWYLLIAMLLGLSFLGIQSSPLLLALPFLMVTIGISLIQAGQRAAQAKFATRPQSFIDQLKLRSLIALLHLLQPLARLWGRLHYGLTPWRRRSPPDFAFPRPRNYLIWSERWQALETRLEAIEATLRDQGAVVSRGGDFDRWDLEIRGGLFGAVRTQMAIEEHGGGKQLVRFRSWPRYALVGLVLMVLLTIISLAAALNQASLASTLLGLIAGLFAIRVFRDSAAAMASFLQGIKQLEKGEEQ